MRQNFWKKGTQENSGTTAPDPFPVESHKLADKLNIVSHRFKEYDRISKKGDTTEF